SFAAVPQSRRTSRAAMAAAAEAFQVAMTADDGKAPAGLADNCRWLVNGQDVGACASAFGSPALTAIDRLRDSEVLAADEERGLIAYRFFEDRPAIGSGYPLTYQVVELYRFVDGKIEQVQAFASELPYGMEPHR